MSNKKAHDVATAYIFAPDYSKILMVKKRFSKRLMPPGGHVDEGETYFQTVIREISEETQLKNLEGLKRKRFENDHFSIKCNCKIADPMQDEEFIVYEDISSEHVHIDHIYCFIMPITFECKRIKCFEISSVRWINIEEVYSKDTYDNVFKTIQYFVRKGKNEAKETS